MAQISTSPQSSAYTTLQDEDILDCLFDTLESRSKGVGRRTLASCALVCKAWSDPASRALWRRLDSFHPLWALLAGRNFPPSAKRLTEFWQIVEPEVFVNTVFVKEPDLWKHFLYRASHVREIGTASCREPELALVCAVIHNNGESTFLPNLQKLVWRNGITSDTSLRLLASPSLRSLELDVASFTTTTSLNGQQRIVTPTTDPAYPGTLFAGLAQAASRLKRLVVAGRQLSSAIVVPNLLGYERMRELSLFREVLIAPDDLRSILTSMPALELLNVRLRDFISPSGTAHSSSLRALGVQGAARDVAGLLASFLDAPALDSLSPYVEDAAYSEDHPRYLRALSTASFTPSLRTLKLSTLTHPYPAPPGSGGPSPLEHAMERLAALRALEVVSLHLTDVSPRIGDDDIRALALAWPHLQRLVLAYIPSNAVPPLAALRHFARHSPELRHMMITKMSVPKVVEETPLGETGGAAGAAGHPMQTLDMRMTFAGTGPYDVAGIARFLDGLFPNMEVDKEDATENGFALMTGTWNGIEREIRELRARKDLQE